MELAFGLAKVWGRVWVWAMFRVSVSVMVGGSVWVRAQVGTRWD